MSPQPWQRQEASSAQRSSSVCLGVCPSLASHARPKPAGRITLGRHGAGTHLAPLGFALGRWLLGTGTKGWARCAHPQQKCAALNRGFSMLLHMNSECENPACPSVP